MPELPEVETMCRGVRSLVGRTVQTVSRPACDCRPCLFAPEPAEMNRRLRGRRVSEIMRRGKRVILRFEGDEYLVVEPRMTGLVLLADPPDPDHLRLR
ncbi:MAG: DNA-formamidopyrimidine glycosylase family protein, partial [Planctomycetota bacterium]